MLSEMNQGLKIRSLVLNRVAKSTIFYLKQGQDVKVWVAQLYPKYS